MDDEMSDQAAEMMCQLLLFYRDQFIKGNLIKHSGIQEAQFRLLNLLSQESSFSMSTLGRLLFISKPHMTTLIDALIREGLAERHPDPHDRRVINVNITEKGRNSLEEAQLLIKKNFKSQLSTLETSDLKIISSSAEQILKVFSKIH